MAGCSVANSIPHDVIRIIYDTRHIYICRDSKLLYSLLKIHTLYKVQIYRMQFFLAVKKG